MSRVEVCLGCGWPTRCITRDCGCPAGTYEIEPRGKPRGCNSFDCKVCRAFDLSEVKVPVKETLEDRFKRIARQSYDYEEFKNRVIAATPDHLRRSVQGKLLSIYAEFKAESEVLDNEDEDPYTA